MASVSQHYEKHLAPVYSWMAGGIENAVSCGQRELAEIGLASGDGRYAVDLGAGFGMHAIPLARQGWRVLAIDSSAQLLEELKAQAPGALITPVLDDMRNFERHLADTPDLILCMGDTLTHLADMGEVMSLVQSAAARIAPNGQFVVSFRDYSAPLEDERRFIAVQSDEARLLTCFLEYDATSVRVHDILHERKKSGWVMRVSAYQKLRIEARRLKEQLAWCGFETRTGTGLFGMIRMVATRSPGGSGWR